MSDRDVRDAARLLRELAGLTSQLTPSELAELRRQFGSGTVEHKLAEQMVACWALDFLFEQEKKAALESSREQIARLFEPLSEEELLTSAEQQRLALLACRPLSDAEKTRLDRDTAIPTHVRGDL